MGSSFVDKNGYRRQRANPISRVGVFPYLGSQIDYDNEFGLKKDQFYWVLRGPEELFAPAALESFQGLPIRVGHVMLGTQPSSVAEDKSNKNLYKSVDDEPADGCIYNVRPSLDEPGFLIAEFAIWTDKMQDILKAGKIKELSLGYTCRYEKCEGVYNGIPYQFKQVGLTGNHLALVKHGRCGSSVCVCDEAVVTFDSLPEGIPLMENKEEKKDDKQLDRVKALAAAIKGGDEQAACDCLDFYDLSPEQRKEALEYVKGKKDEKKDKPAEDKKAKAAKDVEPPPPPPDMDAPAEKKPAESPAPEASAASAPAPEPAPEAAPPPADVPSPKDGEMPAGDKKDGKKKKACCDKCGQPIEVEEVKEEETVVPAEDKAAKSTKDCGVTEPSIPAPIAAVEAPAEEKPGEEKPVKDKADCECKKDTSKDGNCNTCGKPTEKLEDKSTEEVIKQTEETATKDSLGPGKPEALGSEPTPALGKEKTDEPKDPEKYAKVTQDEYAAFAAEYSRAQQLADTLRPHIKETFDSSLMREIDVARFATKHIPQLAFAMDEANDAVVLAAVRGHVAALTAKAEKPVEDEAPKAPAPVAPTAPVFEDVAAPAATPTLHSDCKSLRDFMGGVC